MILSFYALVHDLDDIDDDDGDDNGVRSHWRERERERHLIPFVKSILIRREIEMHESQTKYISLI